MYNSFYLMADYVAAKISYLTKVSVFVVVGV